MFGLSVMSSLTDGVSAEDGVGRRAGQAAAGGVDSNDSELVHGALQQASDIPVVAQRQRSDRIAADAGPTLASGLLLLNEVAGDGGAAVVLRLLPVDSHGLQTDISHGGLLTLTRDGCRRTRESSVINMSLITELCGSFGVTELQHSGNDTQMLCLNKWRMNSVLKIFSECKTI